MMNSPDLYDLFIIGGGINGAGIARDAAGRGLKVALAEQHDLASATSSASTKLIHGGLRYLEYYEFRLVAEALAEREALLAIAPHIIWPQQFVLPHEQHLRPAWLIRLGLFMYDHLGHIPGVVPAGATAPGGRRGRSSLPKSRRVTLASNGLGAGLKAEFAGGFTYFDCWVDDARLVVLNARSAALRGAAIMPHTRCVSARRNRDLWEVTIEDVGGERTLRARALINAAGPWVRQVQDAAGAASSGAVRLVKGSHIVVPRIHDQRHAFILQNPDRRVVFMIPYEREFTLIGTTDVPVGEGERAPQVTQAEIAYLCEAASRYTARPLSPADVVWSYSGVRALYDDGTEDPSAVTRDYHLSVDTGGEQGGAPLLSVFGGKITTYRRLAEHALQKLARWFPGTRAWTAGEALPGGDFGGRTFDDIHRDCSARHPQLPAVLLARLLRRHGTLAEDILGSARTEQDLGFHFGGGLYEAEVRYLAEHEWAQDAHDVLWRRTKCGLHMTRAEQGQVQDFMATLRA